MEILYEGENIFSINCERPVLINPHAVVKGETALYSDRKRASRQIVSGPGEFEIGGALIASVPAGDGGLTHAIDIDGTNILFVDQPAQRLDERALAAIGVVDILILSSEDLKAAQTLANDLTPRVVLPFGKNAAELCTLLGVKDVQPTARFPWNAAGKNARAVLLKPARGKTRAA